MTNYVNPYTGATVSPSQVSYEQLSLTADTILQWPVNGNTSSVVANIIEVTSSSSAWKLIMPSAQQVSQGSSVLIRNIGSNPFYVVNADNGAIVTIPSGIAYFIYVTDNTTDAGLWGSVQFGAGTSAANAAVLDGYGLSAIGNTLNTSTTVTTFSSAYTMLPADQSSIYVWTGGAGTVTLPSASGVIPGWFVIIKNDGTGILTVTPPGTNTIDGQSTAQLQVGESFVVVSSGINFYSYAYGRSATFFFTLLVKNITGGTTTLTSLEAASIIQEYKGTLTSNAIVILPPTVQLYSLKNDTSGAFTLTFKTTTGGASTVVLPQGQTVIAICDGTNVYNAQTATFSTLSSLSLGDGSAMAPALTFTSNPATGIYLAASNQLGFSINGNNAGTLTATGLLIPVGIDGGSF